MDTSGGKSKTIEDDEDEPEESEVVEPDLIPLEEKDNVDKRETKESDENEPEEVKMIKPDPKPTNEITNDKDDNFKKPALELASFADTGGKGQFKGCCEQSYSYHQRKGFCGQSCSYRLPQLQP